MELLHKIQVYKNILIGYVLLSTFVLLSGVVLSVVTWKTEINQSQEVRSLLQDWERLKRDDSQSAEFGQRLKSFENSFTDLKKPLLGVSFLTLFLGLILPVWAFRKLVLALVEAKENMERKVAVFIKEWFENFEKAGSEPYKNPEFWLRVVLIAAEIFIPAHAGLGWIFAKDVARMIKSEINKV